MKDKNGVKISVGDFCLHDEFPNMIFEISGIWYDAGMPVYNTKDKYGFMSYHKMEVLSPEEVFQLRMEE